MIMIVIESVWLVDTQLQDVSRALCDAVTEDLDDRMLRVFVSSSANQKIAEVNSKDGTGCNAR
jgi:hypothetical protein